MIEQSARVVAIDDGAYWFEVQATMTDCERCAQGKGCGGGIFRKLRSQQSLRIRLESPLSLVLHQRVILSIDESVLMRVSLLLYLCPLLGMIALAIVTNWLFNSELISVLGAVLGLGVALMMVRRRHDAVIARHVDMRCQLLESEGCPLN